IANQGVGLHIGLKPIRLKRISPNHRAYTPASNSKTFTIVGAICKKTGHGLKSQTNALRHHTHVAEYNFKLRAAVKFRRLITKVGKFSQSVMVNGKSINANIRTQGRYARVA